MRLYYVRQPLFKLTKLFVTLVSSLTLVSSDSEKNNFKKLSVFYHYISKRSDQQPVILALKYLFLHNVCAELVIDIKKMFFF